MQKVLAEPWMGNSYETLNLNIHVGVSLNGGFSPQIIHFNRVFHYKPSILGETPLFLDQHPNLHCHLLQEMMGEHSTEPCWTKNVVHLMTGSTIRTLLNGKINRKD